MKSPKAYWKGLSERKRAGLRFAGIAAVLLLTFAVTVAVCSYVFTWRQDQSALAPGTEAVENAAATSGLSIGHFLVTDSFGLGAFCIVALLLAWSLKRVWRNCPPNLRKWFYGCITLAFLLSWTLVYVGRFAGC